MGVGLVADPCEEIHEEGGHDRYISHVIEFVKQAILKPQGLMLLPVQPMGHAMPSAGGKRRRAA